MSHTRHRKNESEIEKAAEELHVELPAGNLPLPLKVIALFTLIGGLSIIGSIFSDVVRPGQLSVFAYLLRLGVGVLAVAIAYGIVRRHRWALWLYGLIVAVGLFINPVVASLPLAIAVYLYLHRKYLRPSFLDETLSIVWAGAKELLGFSKNERK